MWRIYSICKFVTEGEAHVKKNFGCLIFILLIVGVIIVLMEDDPGGFPAFDKVVFVNTEYHADNGSLTCKLVLNPDKTMNLSRYNSSGFLEGGQGLWEFVSQDNPVKIRLILPRDLGEGHLSLYNNKQAVFGFDAFEFFGDWYQD